MSLKTLCGHDEIMRSETAKRTPVMGKSLFRNFVTFAESQKTALFGPFNLQHTDSE